MTGMESTWETRELPVLEAVVRYFEEHRLDTIPQAFDLAPMAGLDPEEVGYALLSLQDEYLRIEMTGGGLKNTMVREVYPSARRAVGQWPTPESLAERILAQLEQAAEDEPDEEKRSRLKDASRTLRSAGRDLLINVIATVLTKGTGIS